jgi:hypothetical protein
MKLSHRHFLVDEIVFARGGGVGLGKSLKETRLSLDRDADPAVSCTSNRASATTSPLQ